MDNNIDINKLMQVLSHMKKEDLEASILQANKIIKNGDMNDIVNKMNKSNKKN